MGRFNNLPEEIMLEILSRLPTESLLDCKSVCKSWRGLVHHPPLSQMHLNYLDSASAGKLSFIFFLREIDEFSYAEYDEGSHETFFRRKTRMNLSPPFSKNSCSVVGSCNGLICLGGRRKDEAYQCHYGPAYICNPITREYVMLPKSKGSYWWNGFGYSLSTNEYKVVRKNQRAGGDSNVGVVQVYTLGSGNGWRDVGNFDMELENVPLCAGVFANGALHWVDLQKGTIIAFHLTDEKFSELPSPPWLPQDGDPVYFTKVGVLGYFLSVTYFRSAGGCEIWLLKKKKNDNCNELSWSKEFTFGSSDNCISRPFGYTKSGRLLYYWHNHIYRYDPKDSSAKMDVKFGRYFSEAIPHKNTLISLKVLGEKDIKTMESSESASSGERTENSDKLKKRRTK